MPTTSASTAKPPARASDPAASCSSGEQAQVDRASRPSSPRVARELLVDEQLVGAGLVGGAAGHQVEPAGLGEPARLAPDPPLHDHRAVRRRPGPTARRPRRRTGRSAPRRPPRPPPTPRRRGRRPAQVRAEGTPRTPRPLRPRRRSRRRRCRSGGLQPVPRGRSRRRPRGGRPRARSSPGCAAGATPRPAMPLPPGDHRTAPRIATTGRPCRRAVVLPPRRPSGLRHGGLLPDRDMRPAVAREGLAVPPTPALAQGHPGEPGHQVQLARPHVPEGQRGDSRARRRPPGSGATGGSAWRRRTRRSRASSGSR